MPSILNLKFKGNKSFVAFSNLNDTESLTKTWKVCTKVASYLEQGQRLENLAWRLWHLQNLMVDTDNAKSKREFKKLSKCMGDKLDKEKGRSIEELPAPAFHRTPSTDLLRARAEEKERTREASAHMPEHIIQRMQFTFEVENTSPTNANGNGNGKGDTVRLPSGTVVMKNSSSPTTSTNNTNTTTSTTAGKPAAGTKRKFGAGGAVRLPTLFSTSFGPEALLAPALSLAPRMNYGEAHSHYANADSSTANGNGNENAGAGMVTDMRIARPTIELPLDELLNADADEGEYDYDGENEGDGASSSGAESGAGAFSSVDVGLGGAMNNMGMGMHAVNVGIAAQQGAGWPGWDEIMSGAGAFDAHFNELGAAAGAPGYPVFGPSPSPNDPYAMGGMTMNPLAAFASPNSPLKQQHDLTGGNGNVANPSTPTAPPRSPRLSPNAYFLPELEGEDDVMDGHQLASAAPLPASAPTPSTAKAASHSTFNNSSISTSSRRAAHTGTAMNMDDDESSDDGGDDSADSDFFEQSSRARRARPAAARAKGGAAAGARKGVAGPPASTLPTNSARRPVLSVRVPASAASRAPQTPQGQQGQQGALGQQQQVPTSAPGGVKAECSNCGATHTPLWRRGLNDELNCNACGLYCKLHKRPRPKTMRNSGGGEGRGQSVRSEAVDVMAQCYNCHTTATPLWRKDDEGKTVCNACGLYYKLHGSARPISMKSDVIRKRSRHDARRGGAGASAETPTASPGVSRRTSPVPGAGSSSSASGGRTSPTLAPDSTTTASTATSPSTSELSSALGPQPTKPPSAFRHPYAYHEAYPDALPFASVDVGSELDARVNKRRRMSVDSASEPPSSATSYSSYNDGYGSAVSASASSSQFSMEFPFSRYPAASFNDGGRGGNNGGNGGNAAKNAGVNSFWHPPMMVQQDAAAGGGGGSPESFLHPPMLPTSTAEEAAAPMDYLHPPMSLQDGFFNANGFFQTGGAEGQGMGMGMGMMGVHPPMMSYDDIYGNDAGGGMHY